MTKSFEQLLYLFGASSLGKDVSFDEKLNIEEIRNFALQQGIWPTIYNKLYNLCDVSEYANEVLSMTIKSIRQIEFTFNILRAIEENGIEFCLLKGDSVARFYNKPESRISGDADILINPKDERKLSEILSQKGYKVSPRKQNDHHFKAHHPLGGLLEVHVRLYSYVTEKIIFDGLSINNEPYMEINNGKRKYKTLGINDGLMYLTAHYIKHLVNSGGGIRQMMDLLLYIENYKREIDFDNYFNLLKKLKYEKLIRIVMSIGAKYFGFDYEITDEELVDRILTDTQEGGIFGHSAEKRDNFYNEYCKKRENSSRVYMFLKKESGHNFFPTKQSLINDYGYKYARFTLLIPIAWIHRYIDVILGTRKPEVVAKDTVEFKERTQLMQDLGMI